MGASGALSNQHSCDKHKIVSELIPVLSDQDLLKSLRRAVRKLDDLRANGRVRERRSCRQRPRRPGWILKAIVQVLTDRDGPMRAKDIHRAVEQLIGEPVAWSSVKDALASNVSGTSPRFVRIARGRYVLA